MKITVDVDCSPEEARRFLGLPDLAPVHDVYVGRLVELAKTGGVSSESAEAMMKSWLPVSETGLQTWQTLFDKRSGSATG